MGATSLYYLSRNHAINRIKRMKFSIDMMFNVGTRAIFSGIVSDVVARKLFVNYDRVLENKVATNEIKKRCRIFSRTR